jgi:hypothetical protein
VGDPSRLWTALQAVPGLCTAAAEWRALLGDEYEAASRFLRPEGRSAAAVPCASRAVCGCSHAVVEHGPDDVVSVCRCEPWECDTRPLTRADILLHELNLRALGDAVASALGAVPEQASPPRVATTWGIGTLSPCAGFRFPVYLAVPEEPDDLRRAVDGLVARADGPFLLVVPTRATVAPGCLEHLGRTHAHLLTLADDFVLDPDGTVRPRRPIAEILNSFLSAVLPASRDGSATAFFSTPPDATWESVRIRFRDGHTISVRVGDVRGVFNYTQMGMADGKTGRPTKQWDLLRAFADRHGRLDWSSRGADRRNQKRKETLVANLRAFFRIDGDPFEVTTSVRGEGKGWRSRFGLDPDE